MKKRSYVKKTSVKAPAKPRRPIERVRKPARPTGKAARAIAELRESEKRPKRDVVLSEAKDLIAAKSAF